MYQTKKDVLTTLQEELAFLELGGYRSPQQAAWRPQFIFRGFPHLFELPKPREASAMPRMRADGFVPNGSKQERYPCRHIPLDDSGQTLDSLYRTATEEEAYAMAADWLKKTIAGLERKPVPEGS